MFKPYRPNKKTRPGDATEQIRLLRHKLRLFRRGPRLVVTFDTMKDENHGSKNLPFAKAFLEEFGYSHLAVMMRDGNDWYRHPALLDFFDRMRDEGFFDSFDDVAFYGSSMGGYGALAFSASVPGSNVLAFMPQSSLDPEVVPFETRYSHGFPEGDWNDPRYLDAATSVKTAGSVTVIFDQHDAQDNAHARRLQGDNVIHLTVPFAGHAAAKMLKFMDLLEQTCLGGLNGTVQPLRFAKSYRIGRRNSAAHLRRLVARAIEQNSPERADVALNWGKRHLDDVQFPAMRKQINELRAQLAPARKIQKAVIAPKPAEPPKRGFIPRVSNWFSRFMRGRSVRSG